MTIHCSIDWETLDTRATACVLSLGACMFNPDEAAVSSEILSTCEIFFDIDDQQRMFHRTVSTSTFLWWLQQAEEARLKLVNSNRQSLRDGMGLFIDWVKKWEITHIWANGQDFDIGIMNSIFDNLGCAVPWKYNAPRDMRTLRDCAPARVFENKGIAHSALDDAIYQANAISTYLFDIREERKP